MWNKFFYHIVKKIKGVVKLLYLAYYSLRGARIDLTTSFSKIYFTWPHKVRIGARCVIEHQVYFKYDGIYSKGIAIDIGDETFIGAGTEFNIKYGISIGNKCLIASGCRFVDHDHGIAIDQPMKEQSCPGSNILIGSDVWVGANVVVLKGVTIEAGAVIAAGAIVTRSIPKYEIWGGVPARKIGERKS